ncbi:MAG TPA: hypothetical protein VGS97_29090 [Actinocrinis sp.]|uniref:hypothetical protein n=1 Tax=Actinocrinis sp. TaxID=1920516 RepID=UPI002DDDA42C|nr:hypothetical protein [Actinocrinis sp.]HEV2348176.1 hypothetical protein [Actinocrinis sp.]
MPKIQPAIQWGIALFLLFWIVHDPVTTSSFVEDAFKIVSNFFHDIGNIVSFHSNVH